VPPCSFAPGSVELAVGSCRADDDTADRAKQDIKQAEFHFGRDMSVGRTTLTPVAAVGGRLLIDNAAAAYQPAARRLDRSLRAASYGAPFAAPA
jgi:hypothetical protein